MRRIDAPRAFAIVYDNGQLEAHADQLPDETPVRIVRESDWRRLMTLARAGDALVKDYRGVRELFGQINYASPFILPFCRALDDLNAKPKERKT